MVNKRKKMKQKIEREKDRHNLRVFGAASVSGVGKCTHVTSERIIGDITPGRKGRESRNYYCGGLEESGEGKVRGDGRAIVRGEEDSDAWSHISSSIPSEDLALMEYGDLHSRLAANQTRGNGLGTCDHTTEATMSVVDSPNQVH